MAARKPTLTIFAGPNGSGKSTLVEALRETCDCGVLVNADQIAVSFAKRDGEKTPSVETQWAAARAAEDMRWALMAQQISFVTETVMSDAKRWVTFVKEAKLQGYRVVLYFVTTADASINVKRVAERVLSGGHAVPEGKIVSRYKKVMEEVLPCVLGSVDESVLFDNSSPETGLVGVLHIKHGRITPLVEMEKMPEWTRPLLGG